MAVCSLLTQCVRLQPVNFDFSINAPMNFSSSVSICYIKCKFLENSLDKNIEDQYGCMHILFNYIAVAVKFDME